ncbi:DUF2267 domain-containing protein [Pararhizobium sp. LjRoot235]|uniref:DUF2267 domain-containing protein n=1 Tax=Pararhizobium sp. LjRoot235 TaxID=3342291 RepID=UPI003ECFB0B2
MGTGNLDVFEKTLQTTNIWLDEITAALGPDRRVAWKVLSVVLHKLRDRLPAALSAHLSAELPLLVRGVYYDQFEPDKLPMRWDYDEFVSEVSKWLSDTRPVDPDLAIQAVFRVLSRHLPRGQIDKVQNALPEGLRSVWQTAEEDAGFVLPTKAR